MPQKDLYQFHFCDVAKKKKDFDKDVLVVSVAFSQGIYTLTFSKQNNLKFPPALWTACKIQKNTENWPDSGS